MSYKVLMIDDEFEKESIQDFILNAKVSSIEIVPVKFHDEGMRILKEDRDYVFQAVILDATGFENKDDNELSNIGLKNSIEFLKEFRSTRIIPWFVFTGADRNKKVNEFEREIKRFQKDIKFGRPELTYYIKTENDDDILVDIKNEINRLLATSVEYKYKKVFRIARDLNISKEEMSTMVALFNFLQNAEDIKPGIYFTQIRKCVEYVFRALVKLDILHNKCVDKNNGQINLSESSKLLAGLPSSYLKIKCNKPHFPKILAENVKNLIFITGAASHTSEVDETKNMDYQAYYAQIQSPYLLFQLLFTVSDLFLWYNSYSEENKDKALNKSFWEEIINEDKSPKPIGIVLQENELEYIEAIFISINESNWGTIKCIDGKEVSVHPKSIEKYDLAIGESIWVALEFNEEKNKYHIKTIKK